MPEWYCKVNNKVYGPLSEEELKDWIKTFKLAKTDFVRKGKKGSFISAEKLKNIDWPEMIDDPLFLIREIDAVPIDDRPIPFSEQYAKPILLALLLLVVLACGIYYSTRDIINGQVNEHVYAKLVMGMSETGADDLLGLPNKKAYGKKVMFRWGVTESLREGIVETDKDLLPLYTYDGRFDEHIKILFNEKRQIIATQYSIGDFPIYFNDDKSDQHLITETISVSLILRNPEQEERRRVLVAFFNDKFATSAPAEDRGAKPEKTEYAALQTKVQPFAEPAAPPTIIRPPEELKKKKIAKENPKVEKTPPAETVITYRLAVSPGRSERPASLGDFTTTLNSMLTRLTVEASTAGLLLPTVRRMENEEIESFNEKYKDAYVRVRFHVVSAKPFKTENVYLLDPLGETDTAWLKTPKYDTTLYHLNILLTKIYIKESSDVFENLSAESYLYLEGTPFLTSTDDDADAITVKLCAFETEKTINKPQNARKTSLPEKIQNPLHTLYLLLKDVEIYIK
jgi:hypothetical protein